MGDYFLCIMVVVYHEGSIVNMSLYARTFLGFLVLGLLCNHTPWIESEKASDKTIERKIENCSGGRQKHRPVSLRSHPQIVPRILLLSWLMPSFLYAKADTSMLK